MSRNPGVRGKIAFFMRNSGDCPALVPAQDVALEPSGFNALSSQPWLKVVFPWRPAKTYEILYEAGLEQEVVRPLLRFIAADGSRQEVAMPAACEGHGLWRGRVPARTVEVWISPVTSPGPFTFALRQVRRIPIATRLRYMAASPKRAFFAAAARGVGLEAEADLNLKWVYGRAETQNFSLWRARRATAVEATSLGRQLEALIFVQGSEPADALARSFESLVSQTHQNWRLCVVSPTAEQASWLAAQSDSRLSSSESVSIEDAQTSFVAFLALGDVFVTHALDCIQAHFDRHPAETIVYCDEVQIGKNRVPTPIFKPDWSPVRQAFASYVGRSAFVRGSLAAKAGVGSVSAENWIDLMLRRSDPSAVGHIRRPLLSIHRPAVVIGRPSGFETRPKGPAPKVGIVIPTRDRLDLLAPCLDSLLQKTGYSAFEILVVDNDSVEPQTLKWLDRLKKQDARVSVISKAGNFNFSDLCNFGANSLQSDFILFVNNDTEILQADWLKNLLQLARLPDVGAVGAKLLYPNGRVQHAGIVLGMGGVAGHFGEGADRDAGGWLGGCVAPYEVSAVTGACLMVSRQKFEAVGGFDAVNLPVDLNDVDLCLRLAERGWRAICDCRTTVLHRQSASRGGGALRLQKVYASERSYFLAKWGNQLRDDPYFNPNLSLYDYTATLA